MACIHGLLSRACQHPKCSTPTTAIAESDPSMFQSDSSESGSSEGCESSDEVKVIVDNMKSTNFEADKGM